MPGSEIELGAATRDGDVAPLVLVGLGNPGPDYAGSLHNAGFDVVDSFARRVHAAPFVRRGLSLVSVAEAANRALILAKPQTYMNRSGDAVREVLSTLPVSEVLVVHDELDLPAGKLRLKWGGGAGGHRGIGSILEALGHGEFGRLRVGIGRPPEGIETVEHVLGRLQGDELVSMRATIEAAVDALVLALERGIRAAMNVVNRRVPVEPAQSREPAREPTARIASPSPENDDETRLRPA